MMTQPQPQQPPDRRLVTEAVGNATYGPRGAGLGRAINRARTGGDLKFTCIGDSIFDKTTPGNTGGGPMEKTAALVADRFGIEVATANHAASGFTAARASIMGNVTSAINEQADVVFISLGKNDTGADSGSPYAPGHPRAASLAAIERMCAAIRRNSGRSDIVIICEGPYTASNTAANALLREHSDGLAKIAAVWGAELIDVYPSFTELGDYSHLMYDSTHQNPAGNDLYAQTMLAHFPDREFATVAAASPSRRGMFDMTVVDHDSGNVGYIVRGASSVGALNGVTVTEAGTGWSSQVTSTPGDALTITARATEFHAQVSTAAADAAVVDLIVDGTTVAADLALSTLGKQGTYWVTLAYGLAAAEHTVTLQLKSGTLRRSATAALLVPGGAGFVPNVITGQLAASTSVLSVPADGSFVFMANSVKIALPSGWTSAMLTIHGYAYLMGGSSTDVREIETQVLVGSDDTRLYSTLPAVEATQRQNIGISVTMPLTTNVPATVRSRAFSTVKTGLTIPTHRLHYTLVRTA